MKTLVAGGVALGGIALLALALRSGAPPTPIDTGPIAYRSTAETSGKPRPDPKSTGQDATPRAERDPTDPPVDELRLWVERLLYGPGWAGPAYIRLAGLLANGAVTRGALSLTVLTELQADAAAAAPRLRFALQVAQILRDDLVPATEVRSRAAAYQTLRLDHGTHGAHGRLQLALAGWPGGTEPAELLKRFAAVPRTVDEAASIIERLCRSSDGAQAGVAIELIVAWWQRDKHMGRAILPLAVDALLGFRGVEPGLTELAALAERLREAGADLPHDIQLLASRLQLLLNLDFPVEPRWGLSGPEWRPAMVGWLAAHADTVGDSPGAQLLMVSALLDAPKGDVAAVDGLARAFRTSPEPLVREMALISLGTVADLRTLLRVTGVSPPDGVPADEASLRLYVGLAGGVQNSLLFHPEDQDLGAELLARGLRAARGDSALARRLRESYAQVARERGDLPAIREMLEGLAAGDDPDLAALARQCLTGSERR